MSPPFKRCGSVLDGAPYPCESSAQVQRSVHSQTPVRLEAAPFTPMPSRSVKYVRFIDRCGRSAATILIRIPWISEPTSYRRPPHDCELRTRCRPSLSFSPRGLIDGYANDHSVYERCQIPHPTGVRRPSRGSRQMRRAAFRPPRLKFNTRRKRRSRERLTAP